MCNILPLVEVLKLITVYAQLQGRYAKPLANSQPICQKLGSLVVF